MLGFAATEGTATIHSPARDFLAAFARRIDAGLLSGKPHFRSCYQVTRQQSDKLEFRAMDFWTAFNVGLNQVELVVTPEGQVRYTVRYPRWAGYCILLCALFAIGFIAFLLLYDIRGHIARNRASQVPGLTVDQNVAIAWAMAIFWGFLWPWIMIAVHKAPLRRLMARLIAEVDAEAKR